MQNTSCDHSTDVEHALREHDYCRHSCKSDVEDISKKNVYGEKLERRLDVVHKWADRLLVRVTTEGNWNKIIDREIAILKVQYPFLPQQQLRGKAYKKFEIPAVMGGVVCRASALLGGVIPKDFLKVHKKNDHRMSSHQKVYKLKSLSQFSDNSKKRLKTVSRCVTGGTIDTKNEDPPGIETVTNEETISVNSDETESPTPELEFLDTNEQLSINSKSTQSFNRISHLRNSDDEIDIHSAVTQFVTPNFQLFNNEAVIRDDTLDIADDVRVSQSVVALPACSQIVSPAAIPTQVTVKNGSLCVGMNRNFVPREVSSRRQLISTTTIPTSSSSTGKSSRDEEVMPLFDADDSDDLTQLPTPEIAHFQFSLSSTSSTPGAVSLDYTHGSYRNGSQFLQSQDFQEIIVTETVGNELNKIITVKNSLKRKTSQRGTSSSENKENCTATKHFHKERPRLEKSALMRHSKSVLKSPILKDTLSLVSRTQRLDLNESHSKNKSAAASLESTSPKRKIRRLESHNGISMNFLPLHRSDEKRKMKSCDLTQEDNVTSVEEDFVVSKIGKSSKAKTSTVELLMIQSTSPEKKIRRLESQDRSSINFVPLHRSNKRNIEIVDLTQEDNATNVQKDLVVHKIDESSTAGPLVIEANNQQVSSLSKLPISCFTGKLQAVIENVDILIKNASLDSSRSVLVSDRQKKCSSNSATVEKNVAIINDDGYHSNNTTDSSVSILINYRQENESPKSVADRKPAIASDDGHNSELTAESSASVLIDDHEQKSPQTSSRARLTGTTTTESKLLSDRCCEYDKNFLNTNSSYLKPNECLILENSFKVRTFVINKQVVEILKFLETDISVT